jgi:hypothetical protein
MSDKGFGKVGSPKKYARDCREHELVNAEHNAGNSSGPHGGTVENSDKGSVSEITDETASRIGKGERESPNVPLAVAV